MTVEPDARRRWQHVKGLLAQVLEQPWAERHAFAQALSEGDPALREELLSLLAAEADVAQLQSMPPEQALQALQALQAHLGEQNWSGRRIGPWRITSLIARGGMGEVYRAERADGQFEQQVAIKLLRSGFDREWLVSRFAVERQIVARLDHPNLARVLDGGTTDDGMPYFVMELVEGEPIDRYCQRLQLGVPERLALFRTVCQVVGYAHSKGVVHRDLKSDNILVTEQGVVKLVDFGIAKQLTVEADKTATGQRVMTLAFSSPEQVRGQEITPASDVYSLGVALYRLLTQASPYGSITADSGYELARAICDTEPQPPSRAEKTAPLTNSQRRRLRGDLDAVVMMALRKDPARRYANAAEMGDDIFRHMESLPVRARRGAWSYRANRFVLRHRAVFGAAMLANLALVIGLGMAIYQSVEANRQRARAERHLATVREFANVLIFDVHEAIAKLPGATTARKLVVERALAYLESVGTEMHDNPSLQLEIATAYRKLADIQGAPHVANLGDPAGAKRSYQKTIDILSPLSPAQFSDPAQRRALRAERITTWGLLSRLLLEQDDRQGSLILLVRARDEAQAQVAENPDEADAVIALARCLTMLANHGRHDYTSGNTLALLDKAQSQLAPVIAKQPDNKLAVRAMMGLHFTRGEFYRDRNGSSDDRNLAIAAYQLSLALGQRLAELDPDNAIVVRDNATAGMPYAQLLAEQGKPEQAEKVLKDGIAKLTALAQSDTANMEVRSPLATLHSVLGSVYGSEKKSGEAIVELKAAVALLEQTHGKRPANTMYRVNLAAAYGDLGAAMKDKAKATKSAKPGASAEYCQMFVQSLSLLDVEPPVPGYVTDFAREITEALKGCEAPATKR